MSTPMQPLLQYFKMLLNPGFGALLFALRTIVAGLLTLYLAFLFDLDQPKSGPDEGPEEVSESLEAAPPLPGFDIEIPIDADSPAGKLTLWQRKLLDLTTRNRLLHLPD